MLFTFLFSLFGFVFVIRTARELIRQTLFSRTEVTKIGIACFVVISVLQIFISRHHLSIFFSVLAPIFFLGILLFSLVKRRNLAFREELRDALTITLMKMRTGRSFRQSFSEVVTESRPSIRVKLSEIASVVAFSQQNKAISGDYFVSELVEELIRIDRNPHTAMKRLSVLRTKLKMEDDFRRRSGQVLARIRAQSYVMVGLYFAVAVFVIGKFGWRSNERVVLVSALVFALGQFWIWRGGRKMKWKV
jgi:hypothetical protein